MSKKLDNLKRIEGYLKEVKKLELGIDDTDYVKEIDFGSLFKYYTEVADVTKMDDVDSRTIQAMVNVCQYIYNNSSLNTPLTDDEYDKLYEVLVEVTGDNIIGATNPQGKKIRAHQYPSLRGSLSKIHFITNKDKGKDKRKSLEDWIKSIETTLGRKMTSDEAKVIIQPKWDGCSLVFECNKDGIVDYALLRGDVNKNEAVDVSYLFEGISFSEFYKDKKAFGLKTEVMMSDNDYEDFCKKYGEFSSPRSATTSIINSKDATKDMVDYLTIQPLRIKYENDDVEYSIPQPHGMDIASYIEQEASLNDIPHLHERIKLVKALVTEMGLITDGVVLSITNKDIIEKLGRDNHINNYEIAYKFPPESKVTTIKDIEFSMGVLGNISPVAKIHPVKIRWNKISSISLGSIDRFNSLNIRLGDEVRIKYEIIPYLEKDADAKEGYGDIIKAPTHCMYCNEELNYDPELRCVNDNCKSRIVGKILNYVEKMRIASINVSTIETLFQAGILNSIEDLYTLNEKEEFITDLPRFGTKTFNNIIKGIDNRREAFDYEVLGSIGIQDIGERMFKKVLSVYKLNDILLPSISDGGYVKLEKDLCKIDGIKDATAKKIIHGIIDNFHLIRFLRKEIKVKSNDRVYDKKVCFSKIRDAEFEKFLDLNNVLVMDSFTKETDILIVPDTSEESSKISKAIKQGKPVIDLKTAHEYFKYKGDGSGE